MKNRILLATAAIWVVAAVAQADDINPPPWQRATPISTSQGWDFDTGSGGQPDDPINGLPGGAPWWNPNGTPLMTDAVNANWLPTFSGRTGCWSILGGGLIQFVIPNTPPDPTREKHVWAQITWKLLSPTGTVSLTPFGPPEGTIIDHGTITLADTWMHSTFEYILPHNPEREFYQVRNDAPGTKLVVDQVVIDSICAPEPGTFVAIGVGILLLAARRRK